MVVVGAGFGGLAVARGLADAPVEVTLVDRNNFHTFQPLLYQVATSGLNPADVAYPVRGIFQRQRNVRFRRATVTGVDWEAGEVTVDSGDPLAFDHLVVAAGAEVNDFGIPGVAQHGFPLYVLPDAVHLRNHILGRFEAADADPAAVDDGALTFVVVGGGPTGVEVAGALVELIDKVLHRDFRGSRFDVRRAHVVLVEMLDDLLPPFRPGSRRYARSTLAARGVEVRTGTSVAEVTATRVRLGDGTEIPAHTLVWAAGVKAGALATALDVPTGRGGRITVAPDLRIAGHPEAFAIGDIAAITAGDGSLLPGVAQVAMQSGHHVATLIQRGVVGEGDAHAPFRYRDKGSMATIGRRSAVTELGGGIRLTGTPAWVAWLGLHLVYLMGFRNRVSVFVNWAWNYLTWDRGARLILGSGEGERGTTSTGSDPEA
ncbi:NAD(P)/FAD-dependent oxidoreductase [Iamia sp. SCSIO 61187]|nr:NAD(P)/FAD-dependent oxidoreductase [Iamia sp. SCSIO 61187]